MKRYIIRQIDDPVGLVRPVLKIHLPRHPALQEYFDTEEEALDAIREFGDRNYMDWTLIPVYSL